jgi:alpha-mannosidase
MTWKIEKRGNRICGECDFMLPPKAAADRKGRAGGPLACKLSVQIELHPNESLVRIRTAFDNHCEDHRLRACFPTGIESDVSMAETAFGLVTRPRQPEPCSGFWEKTTASNPQRRFVILQNRDRGFVLFNRGLPEFEADPNGLLRLTLLRSVGWLSRGDMLTRPWQAGPEIFTPDAQCQGQHVFEYALYLFSGPVEEQGIFRLAEEYLHPLDSIAIQTQKTACLRPPEKNFMSIDNKRIVVSCFKADGQSFILRVYNPFARSETFFVRWALPLAEARLISLGGSEIQSLNIEAEGHGFTGRTEAYSIMNYRIVFKNP